MHLKMLSDVGQNIIMRSRSKLLQYYTSTHSFTIIVFCKCLVISFQCLHLSLHFICFLFEFQCFFCCHTQGVYLDLKFLVFILGWIKFLQRQSGKMTLILVKLNECFHERQMSRCWKYHLLFQKRAEIVSSKQLYRSM